MNKQQKAYAAARAHFEAISELSNQNEAQFILEQGVINPDGSIPDRLFKIDDLDVFDRVCELFYLSPLCLDDEYNAAEKELRQAEDLLIEYALSLVPPHIAGVLRECSDSIQTRQQLIDLTFRLDSSTVPPAE